MKELTTHNELAKEETNKNKQCKKGKKTMSREKYKKNGNTKQKSNEKMFGRF